MPLFTRKPSSPLAEALRYISAAAAIVSRHAFDATYTPTAADFQTLQRLDAAFHHGTAITGHTEQRMRQRLAGEPEGSRKWHDDAVFDYHYRA